MSVVLDDLRAVRSLLSDEKCWTKGNFAQDEHGKYVPLGSEHSCKWCLMGAAMKVAPERWTDLCNALTGNQQTTAINDDPRTTHADVLRLIDDAIQREETKAAP